MQSTKFVDSFFAYLEKYDPSFSVKYEIPRNAGEGADLIIPATNNSRLVSVLDDVADDECYFIQQDQKETRIGIPFNKTLYVVLLSDKAGANSPNKSADKLIDEILKNSSITTAEISANDYDVADVVTSKSNFNAIAQAIASSYGDYESYDDPSGKGKLMIVSWDDEATGRGSIIIRFN